MTAFTIELAPPNFPHVTIAHVDGTTILAYAGSGDGALISVGTGNFGLDINGHAYFDTNGVSLGDDAQLAWASDFPLYSPSLEQESAGDITALLGGLYPHPGLYPYPGLYPRGGFSVHEMIRRATPPPIIRQHLAYVPPGPAVPITRHYAAYRPAEAPAPSPSRMYDSYLEN
jgi:hypothetical protein